MAMTWSHRKASAMLRAAARAGKTLIPIDTLAEMIESTPRCPHCSVEFGSNGLKTSVSIQHWNSGDIGLLCFSCNSRHRYAGDKLFKEVSAANKICSDCKQILMLERFGPGPRFGGRTQRCYDCDRAYSHKKHLKRKQRMHLQGPS